MATAPAAPAAALIGRSKPIVLVGPPRSVRGEFEIRSQTDERLIFRDVQLRGAAASGRKSAGGAAPLPGPPLSLRRIVLRQGQVRRIPIVLALDPATPPGTYHAELVLNDIQRDVVVHVTEDSSLVVTPEHAFLPNRPGTKLRKQIVLINEGNLAVSVPKLGAIVLDEDLVHCRALRGALSDVGDTMKSLDDFAVALGRRYKALYETLLLKVQNKAVTLEPGDSTVLDLTITLPEKLDPQCRYTGAAPIATGSLSFTIVPE